MIKKGEILTLSNGKEYVVVSSFKIDNINYVYIINQDDYSDILYCKYVNNSLEIIKNPEMIKRLSEMVISEYK